MAYSNMSKRPLPVCETSYQQEKVRNRWRQNERTDEIDHRLAGRHMSLHGTTWAGMKSSDSKSKHVWWYNTFHNRKCQEEEPDMETSENGEGCNQKLKQGAQWLTERSKKWLRERNTRVAGQPKNENGKRRNKDERPHYNYSNSTVTLLISLLESWLEEIKLDYKNTKAYRLKLNIMIDTGLINETNARSSFYCRAVALPC